MTSLGPIIGQFLDPAALGIVVGGTILATLLRAPSRDARRAVAALGTLGRRHFRAAPLRDQVSKLDRIALRHGVVTLEQTVITDPDVAAAITAIVDGAGPVEVRALLDQRRRDRIERHVAAAEVWAGAAEAAPAMGMIGTLIGLARMFATMSDPAAIGGAMAIALLATLYGALIANLVAQPIATRLRTAARAEAHERTLIEQPLIALAEREAPRHLVAA